MIERYDSVRFLFEAPQTLRIGRKAQRQEFKGGFAARSDVGCQIDLAHPPGTDSCGKLVVADPLTHEQIRWRVFKNLRAENNCGSFKEAANSFL